MISKASVLATRYADAFLRVYNTQITSENIKAIENAAEFFEKNHWYLSLLQVPVLDQEKKRKALLDLLVTQMHVPECIENLLSLLAHQRRLSLIGLILHAVHTLYLKKTDTHVFIVESSADLNEKEKKDITKFLAEHVKHVIIKEYKKNAQLIAGLRMQSATYLFEHSIQKQLTALARQASITH